MMPDEVSWSPLRESSVDDKIAAVGLFPNLLEKIAEEQQAKAKKIEESHQQFDDLATAIGMNAREDA